MQPAPELPQNARQNPATPDTMLQSHDMERGLLACLMSMAESFEEVRDTISRDDFHVPRHQLIYDAIFHLDAAQLPYDEVMVFDWLSRHDKLNEVGGEAYLLEVISSPANAYNLKIYANQLKQFSVYRALIRAGQDITARASAKTQEVAQIIEHAETQIGQISASYYQGNKAKVGPQVIGEILPDLVNELQELMHMPEGMLRGLPTPFDELNFKIQGLQAGNLIIIAARPSMGKTTFAMNLIESVLRQTPELPILVFNMEMQKNELLKRMLASLSGMPLGGITSGRLQETEWVQIFQLVGELRGANLYIDDGNNLSPSELKSRARKIASRHGGRMGLILIDYLQLMRVAHLQNNRVGEISEISRSLKVLAREMNCPVIALSQLNRKLEDRGDKRPVMSDLRESGAIEQDADIIMFIYRDEVYHKEKSKEKGIAQIIIAKNRNGPTTTVRLGYEGQYSRFTNLQPDYAPPQYDE